MWKKCGGGGEGHLNIFANNKDQEVSKLIFIFQTCTENMWFSNKYELHSPSKFLDSDGIILKDEKINTF